MVGYAVLLVSFPARLLQWLPPNVAGFEPASLSFLETLTTILTGAPPTRFTWDAITSPTPLDALRTDLALGMTMAEAHTNAMLSALFVCAAVMSAADPGAYAGPLFHLTSGASMLGAFFIATDPVSAATSDRGRLIYGAGIGVLTYVIRTWGGYPDGIAFAVLIMNLAVPLIDRYTIPRIYGHAR